MIPVAMCAAPRNEDVAQQCVASVRAAGFDDITIFAEPGTDLHDIRPYAEVHQNSERFGEWHNWMQSAEWLLSKRVADRLATMQDDIVLCQNVHAFASSLSWPSEKCGAVHLYTSKKYRTYPLHKLSKLHEHHAKMMCGACAIMFSRLALTTLVRHGLEHGWRGHTAKTIETPHLMEGLDTYLGETLTHYGYEIWICNPSLGQHIAKESTLGHGGPIGSRIAANWTGEEADARELIRCT